MKPIVIVGPRCSGKTSVGKKAAEILGWKFIDGDEYIVGKFKPDYADIDAFVAANGWGAFRKVEAESIEELCKKFGGLEVVFTPGGGAVAHDKGEEYRQKNVKALRAFGNVYYIIPDPNNLEHSSLVLAQRSIQDPNTPGQRPSLTGTDDVVQDTLVTVRNRHELYRGASDHVIPTGGKTIDQVAMEIVNLNL